MIIAVTGTWALPFAAYFIYLSNRVSYRRVKDKKYLGENLPDDATVSQPGAANQLQLETRCHANFAENVPFAFVIAAAAELNGVNRQVLNYALATLFALRILHVELGLKGEGTLGVGRPLGTWGTQGLLAGIAGYGAYLVKGYWGY